MRSGLARRYNCENGGPAPEKLTNAIYKNTTSIKEYWIAEESLQIDLDRLGRTQFMVQHQDGKFGQFAVEARPLKPRSCHPAHPQQTEPSCATPARRLL